MQVLKRTPRLVRTILHMHSMQYASTLVLISGSLRGAAEPVVRDGHTSHVSCAQEILPNITHHFEDKVLSTGHCTGSRPSGCQTTFSFVVDRETLNFRAIGHRVCMYTCHITVELTFRVDQRDLTWNIPHYLKDST